MDSLEGEQDIVCDRVTGQSNGAVPGLCCLKSTGVSFGVKLTVLSPAFAHKKCFEIKTEALGEEVSILCRTVLVCECFRNSLPKGGGSARSG